MYIPQAIWKREFANDGVIATAESVEISVPLHRFMFIVQIGGDPVLSVCFLKMGECREVLGGGPAPPSKL